MPTGLTSLNFSAFHFMNDSTIDKTMGSHTSRSWHAWRAASRLGYGSYPVAVVPDSWVELFVPGVNLSIDDALCPPAATKDQPCS